jgi:RNA polymerase sigma factor (TIGR02999 family)
VRRSDPSATLSPTVLVNEAWLKLARSPGFASTSRLHFKRIAGRAMRQVLVEAARRRNADKRGGGGEVVFVTFDESIEGAASWSDDLLALDEALTQLAKLEPRQAQMVESRFFAGMDVADTATLLEISEETLLRDWRAARAWLGHKVRQAI